MLRKLSAKGYGSSIIAVMFITTLLTGLNGLFSFIFLMIFSELNIGRDSCNKHGLSPGKSRLGGVAIVLSITIGCCSHLFFVENLNLLILKEQINIIIMFSFFIGLIGLIEDLSQSLSSLKRLVVMMLLVSISLYLMPDLIPLDLKLFQTLGLLGLNDTFVFVFIFTLVMICGFINAGNIADGANGLLTSIFFAFFIVAYSLDNSIFNFSVMISLIAFIIFNVMTGKIFLGDFGAYSLSALVAFKSLEFYSNENVSVFFLATLLVYPCFELARSLLFRLARNTPMMRPDNNHLHNYVNEYIVNIGISKHVSNSFTGIGIALSTSGIPLFVYFYGTPMQSNIWQIIFALQITSLSLVYLFFEKKSRENTNHCYN